MHLCALETSWGLTIFKGGSTVCFCRLLCGYITAETLSSLPFPCSEAALPMFGNCSTADSDTEASQQNPYSDGLKAEQLKT